MPLQKLSCYSQDKDIVKYWTNHFSKMCHVADEQGWPCSIEHSIKGVSVEIPCSSTITCFRIYKLMKDYQRQKKIRIDIGFATTKGGLLAKQVNDVVWSAEEIA